MAWTRVWKERGQRAGTEEGEWGEEVVSLDTCQWLTIFFHPLAIHTNPSALHGVINEPCCICTPWFGSTGF